MRAPYSVGSYVREIPNKYWKVTQFSDFDKNTIKHFFRKDFKGLTHVLISLKRACFHRHRET